MSSLGGFGRKVVLNYCIFTMGSIWLLREQSSHSNVMSGQSRMGVSNFYISGGGSFMLWGIILCLVVIWGRV